MTCFGRRKMGIGNGSWPRAAAAVRETSQSLCPTAKWQTATVRQGARYTSPRWQTVNDVRHTGEAHVPSHCRPVPAKFITTTGDEVRAAPPHTKIIVMIMACLRGCRWETARGRLTETYRSTDRALMDSRLAVTGRSCGTGTTWGYDSCKQTGSTVTMIGLMVYLTFRNLASYI